MQLFRQSRIAIRLFSMFMAVSLPSVLLYAASASASEVRLAFAASDRQGHIVNTLRSSDIAVVDNGSIIRQFLSFRPASESPLDLVILLDSSESVASQIPAEIAEIKRFFADSAWGDRTKVSIIAFGGLTPQLLCARDCNGKAAQLKLNTLRADGDTPLYDALFQAAEVLKESRYPESRPAMILFSDGLDSVSMHSALDAAQAAQNLQSAIYAVNSRSAQAAPGNGDAVLDYLAASTGGLKFKLGQDVSAVLRMVLDDLQRGYVLTYTLPAQSVGQHSLQILPRSDPKLKFRSRRGYSVEPAHKCIEP